MIADTVPAPQFVADTTAADDEPGPRTADHSDEAMQRLRHPFDPQPAATGVPGGAGERVTA